MFESLRNEVLAKVDESNCGCVVRMKHILPYTLEVVSVSGGDALDEVRVAWKQHWMSALVKDCASGREDVE